MILELAASKPVPTPIHPDVVREIAGKYVPDWYPKVAQAGGPMGKVDWRRMQSEDGIAIQGAAIRVGILIAGQQESLIEWLRGGLFSAGRVEPPPAVWLEDEVRREFLRFYLRSYFDGAIAYRDWRRAERLALGLPADDDDDVIVTFTEPIVDRLDRHAQRLAQAVVHGIKTRVMPALESAWSPMGEQVRTADMIEGELRSIYAGIIEPAEGLAGADILSLARGRPMKIRNRTQWDAWQKQRVPFTKWIKQPASAILDGRMPPQLTQSMTTRVLQTERTRFFNHAVWDRVREDEDVMQMMFVTRARACAVCAEYNGTVRPKSDPFWADATPPLHHGCYCAVIPVFTGEGVRNTPKRDLPDPEDIAPGFGLYDPTAIKTAKALGITRSEVAAVQRRASRR